MHSATSKPAASKGSRWKEDTLDSRVTRRRTAQRVFGYLPVVEKGAEEGAY